MGPEMAFVLGVLVGQWLLLYAIWRALIKLVQILAALAEDFDQQTSIVRDIVEIPPVDIGSG